MDVLHPTTTATIAMTTATTMDAENVRATIGARDSFAAVAYLSQDKVTVGLCRVSPGSGLDVRGSVFSRGGARICVLRGLRPAGRQLRPARATASSTS
jgi:hypothetical protein